MSPPPQPGTSAVRGRQRHSLRRLEPCYMDSATYGKYAVDTMKTEKVIIEKLGMGRGAK